MNKRFVLTLLVLMIVSSAIVVAQKHGCYELDMTECSDISVTNNLETTYTIFADYFLINAYNHFTNVMTVGDYIIPEVDFTTTLVQFTVPTTEFSGLINIQNALDITANWIITGDIAADKFVGSLNLDETCDDASNRVVGTTGGVSFIFKDESASC